MRAVITTVAIGGWYPRGAARMIEKFAQVSSGFELQAYIDVFPPGAPGRVVVDGYDYSGYCAKPFALLGALRSGAEIGILLDASFYPIRHIEPLVNWIGDTGYYFCRNGFNLGEWSSDAALAKFEISRERAFAIEEISSYCVGVHRKHLDLVEAWCESWPSFPGPHSNVKAQDKRFSYRNEGFVSDDPRVRGHRHDQTALTVLAWRAGLQQLVDRPRFTTYYGHETAETVLVNRGGL